jgi:STE24 endopeptidase
MAMERKRALGLALALPLALATLTFLLPGAELAAQEVTTTIPEASHARPFDVDAATEAYLAQLTPEQRERSDNYFEGGYWLLPIGLLYGLAVAWLLLSRGFSARMRDVAARIGRKPFLIPMVYWMQYLLASTLLGLPLSIYTGYFREHAYGLSNQTFGEWTRDQLVGLGIGLVLGGLAIAVLYLVARKAPRTWWIWGTGVAIAFMIFGILIGPVYIDPLFNKYELLQDKTVLDPILSMARASGVDVDRVYEFDASRQHKRISANVAGFANTMRIALNDNLLQRCSVGEVKAVMGHEIGHYVLNHVYESIIFLGLVLLIGFAFLRWAFEAAVARWGASWGVHGIADPAGLPLLVAILSLYFFALTPFLNTYIRENEAEADIYGLHAAREPDGFAAVAVKLSEYRKLSPGPLEEWFFFDHPSGRARIHMAMTWKAEHLDDPQPPVGAQAPAQQADPEPVADAQP